MSLIDTVRPSVAGVQWQGRPDVSKSRSTTTSNDVVDRDEYVPGSGASASNPYDKVMDKLRTAALRRDAALTGTSDTEDAKSSADDSAIEHEARRERQKR